MIWRFGKGMMHHAFTFRRVILIVCIVVALMVPASAQDGHGSGVIREGTTEDLLALRQFNPLLCDNFTCVRITNLMSPRLLNVDPQSVQFTGADAGSNTLVADWSISADGLSYTMTIRDDLIWSDGTPVTAYDALFSLSLVLQDELFLFYYDGDVLDDVIVGFSAPDENTLVMQLEQPTCEVLDLIDLPMIPAHVFDADFAGLVGDTVTAEDAASQVEQWMAVNEDYDYERVRTHPFSLNPLTTNESFFTFDEVRATEHLRLVSPDGQLAYEFVPIAGGNDGITRFLRRELNYEHNFPYTRTKDLLAAGATVEGGPTTAIYAIALNLADPMNPRDWDTEYEDGQGIHPVWGDIRVRRAAQLALNVPDLINRTVDGNGTPINGFAPPDAVFYNKDMPLPSYDFYEARRLLEVAGWRDTNGDGVRECRECETAEEGALLSIRIAATGSNTDLAVAQAVVDQLRQVGFEAQVSSLDTSSQFYDATLIDAATGYPYNPVSLFERFEIQEDRFPDGLNITSYANPLVDDLLASAETRTDCTDIAARAEHYQQVQTLLAEDYAYLWLFAPHRVYAVGSGVRGFDPAPSNPQWNVGQWTITGETP